MWRQEYDITVSPKKSLPGVLVISWTSMGSNTLWPLTGKMKGCRKFPVIKVIPSISHDCVFGSASPTGSSWTSRLRERAHVRRLRCTDITPHARPLTQTSTSTCGSGGKHVKATSHSCSEEVDASFRTLCFNQQFTRFQKSKARDLNKYCEWFKRNIWNVEIWQPPQ